jgi:hypothetical protein
MTIDDVYRLYLAIRLHFTTDYDITKYKGAVKIKALPSNIKTALEYLAKRIPHKDDLVHYFIANQLQGDTSNGIFSVDGDEIYFEWKRRYTNLFREFQQDIEFMVQEHGTDVTEWFPEIPRHLLSAQITLETVVILNKIYKYKDSIVINNPAWDEASVLASKYSPFLKIDRSAYVSYLDSLGIRASSL